MSSEDKLRDILEYMGTLRSVTVTYEDDPVRSVSFIGHVDDVEAIRAGQLKDGPRAARKIKSIAVSPLRVDGPAGARFFPIIEADLEHRKVVWEAPPKVLTPGGPVCHLVHGDTSGSDSTQHPSSSYSY